MVESLPNKKATNTPKYWKLYVDDNFCILNTNALIISHHIKLSTPSTSGHLIYSWTVIQRTNGLSWQWHYRRLQKTYRITENTNRYPRFHSHHDKWPKNRHARGACYCRWRVRNVLLARYKCSQSNKTECRKRCVIFVVYITDLEIFYCRYFFLNCEESWVVKGRAWPYITNELSYLQRCR